MLTYSIVRNSTRNIILLQVLQAHTTFRKKKASLRWDLPGFKYNRNFNKWGNKSPSLRKGSTVYQAMCCHTAHLRQRNCMQKQLDFCFLEVIRDRESIKPDILWQSESLGFTLKISILLTFLFTGRNIHINS